MSKEILITRKNVNDLKIGDTVKFHNGYEWDTKVLGEFELKRGYVTTGIHNETASFVNPMFKSMYLINQNKEYDPNQDPENKGSEAYKRESWKAQFGSMDGFDKAHPEFSKKKSNNIEDMLNDLASKEMVRQNLMDMRVNILRTMKSLKNYGYSKEEVLAFFDNERDNKIKSTFF